MQHIPVSEALESFPIHLKAAGEKCKTLEESRDREGGREGKGKGIRIKMKELHWSQASESLAHVLAV